MSTLELHNVAIDYGDYSATRNINFTIENGQLACLLGPSGCGKTTLLRAIAGFEKVTTGSITLGGQLQSANNTHLQPEKRNIGMVFQDYALFPHLNVADNIAFGIRRKPRKERAFRIRELLALVELSGYEQRFPHEISGGQQQRIALARALAPRPQLLLLDEPFASQDVELRETLAREVRQILQLEGTTALLVTHDQFEAFAMADAIGVMQDGEIRQWDSSYNLYHQPANQFVADFIGQGAMITGHVVDQRTVSTVMGNVYGHVPKDCKVGCPVDVLIRPDDIQLGSDATGHSATVTSRVFRGAHFLYTLELSDRSEVLVIAPSHQVYECGDVVYFDLDVQHLVMLKSSE